MGNTTKDVTDEERSELVDVLNDRIENLLQTANTKQFSWLLISISEMSEVYLSLVISDIITIPSC